MNLSEIVAEHYLPNKRERLRASTLAGYASSLDLYVLPRWGVCEIEAIAPADVQAWVDGMAAPGAAEKAYKCLRQVVRYALLRLGVRAADPTLGVELPRKAPYRPATLEAGELAAMLRCLWGHPFEAVVLCAATLGLRRGEACGLEWADIDLKTGLVRISKSRQLVAGSVITVGTKTDRSTRSCYLPRFAVKRLRQVKGRGRLIGDASPDKVARSVASHCRREKAPCVSMTNLRHTWATLAVEAGVGIETVAMMLGHSDIATAYDHYIVPRKSICQDAQAAVERLLFRA